MKRSTLCVALALGISSCAGQHNSIPTAPSTAQSEDHALATAASSACMLQPQSFSPPGTSGTVAAGISATDAWAIDAVSTDPNLGAMVKIHHYDGVTWHNVAAPVAGSAKWWFARVDSIYPIASNDVWAIGEGFFLPKASFNTSPFILHWNGTRWSVFPNPPSFVDGQTFDGMRVSADARNDVWVASTAGRDFMTQTLHLARWNGSTWNEYSIRSGFEVGGLQAFAPNNVWVTVFEFPTGLYHFDGTQLRFQPLPRLLGQFPKGLRFVVGTSPIDIWTGGDNQYMAHKAGLWSPFIVSMNPGEALFSVAPFRSGYAVAVASTLGSGATASLLVYNGIDRWRHTASPFGSFSANETFVVPGTTSFWADMFGPSGSFAGLVTCPAKPPPPL